MIWLRCVSEEALEIHTRKHEEDPNYCKKRLRTIQCETCKRNFFDVVEYGSHVCKHFTCDMCDMSFVVERNLKKHKRVHEGENFFNCDMCESMYTKRYISFFPPLFSFRGLYLKSYCFAKIFFLVYFFICLFVLRFNYFLSAF